MNLKLFQEKSITWHSNKGSVDFLIIVFAILLLCILPIQLFLINALFDMVFINKTKDILHTASINSFQAFNEESLGEGITAFNVQEGKRIFCDTAEDFFKDNHRFYLNTDLKPEFFYKEKSIVVKCVVEFKSFLGSVKKIKEKTEFLPEFP